MDSNTRKNTKVSVFKMINGIVERQKWREIGKGARKAFREVLNTATANNEECYVFGYCDAQVEFSAVCMIKFGEAVFYLQDAMEEDDTAAVYAHNFSQGALEVVK